MATKTAIAWPTGWRYASQASAKWTYDADATSTITTTAAGQFIRSFRGASDTSGSPATTDVGVPLSSVPTDGSAYLRIVGENMATADGTPAPRFAGLDRATGTGYATPGSDTVFGWPALKTGPFDVKVPITATHLETARSKFGGGDNIELFVVMSLPQGTVTSITLEWPEADPIPGEVPPVIEAVDRPHHLTYWDGSREVPVAVDALAGDPAWRFQTPPFQPVPSVAALWPAQATTPVRVMSWGDSQTDGTSAGTGGVNSWPSLLSRAACGSPAQRMPADSVTASTTLQPAATGVQWVNHGFGGSTAGTFLPDPLVALAARFQPHVVTIQVGVNDCLTGVSLDVYRRGLTRAVDAALGASTTTVVVVLSAWEAATMRGRAHSWAEYRAVMREVVSSRGDRVVFADTAEHYAATSLPTNDLGGLLATDDLHFTVAGHQEHAALVGGVLGIPYTRPAAAVSGAGMVVLPEGADLPAGTPSGAVVIRTGA
ncbi:MAG: SGNH/GDSL hydrolase family protein [Actinomyces sp.]|uniref:SGNH/GDSL hydrolase family protein n=1 Tax=Actinomyces sp. TaxID=29317 RepID=UPI0026DDCBE5|nr:SGNH/GDSL hydrolase family protein [Actinomyces sp.]MDO4243818.1 SGNH/GDSL hydrolase family protein [Actinomyces sp.]